MTHLSSTASVSWVEQFEAESKDCQPNGTHLLPANNMDVGAPTHGPDNCLCEGSHLYPGAHNGVNDYLMEGGTRSYLGVVRRDDGFGYADRMISAYRRSNVHGMVMADREFVKSEAVNRAGLTAGSAEESVGYLIGVYQQQFGKPCVMGAAVFILPQSRAVAMILHEVAALHLSERAEPQTIVERLVEAARELKVPVATHDPSPTN